MDELKEWVEYRLAQFKNEKLMYPNSMRIDSKVSMLREVLEKINDLNKSNVKGSDSSLSIFKSFKELRESGLLSEWDKVDCICKALDRDKCSLNCKEYEA